jgi:folate-binding protein YgfZ
MAQSMRHFVCAFMRYIRGMMTTRISYLTDRSVLRLSGRDARPWLQSLVTNDVEKVHAGDGRYAALLTPQGKILFDFFVAPDGENLLIDCRADQAQALAKRLSMYKLRSDVSIALAGDLSVAVAWGDAPPLVSRAILYADPRSEGLGWRMIGEPQEFDLLGIEGSEGDAYAAHRISCGVPEGGIDFAYGVAFPHEANMDLLHGVDFRKGCYIGQEVVSRVHHRGTARRRILRVNLSAPVATGTPVMAGEIVVGEIGSVAGNDALASLRTDRVEEAANAGVKLKAGDSYLTPIT